MNGPLRSLYCTAILILGGTAAYSQTPVIDPARVALNSASFATGQPVAPGSLVSIFGTNLASGNTLASTVPLSTSLANVSVTFNGVPAALSGVFHDATNGDQINAQVPWELLPVLPSGTNGTAQVIVTRNNIASAPQNVSIAPAAPGVFAFATAGGQLQAIAYSNSDGAIAAAVGAIPGLITHPAKINDAGTLVILATGLGAVDTTVPDGDVPGVITSSTRVTPTVLVGNVPAQVVFSGMVGKDSTGTVYGFVGVYQLNIVIAPGTPTGNAVPLQIQMNGITTTAQATIAVAPATP